MSKIVFLDFDGVLNTDVYFKAREARDPNEERDDATDLDPEAVDRLNRILDATGAVVVVSSSWRHGKTPEVLQAILARRGFTGTVIDKTVEWLPGRKFSECVERRREILHWLDEHPEVTSCVVIDDDPGADIGKQRFVRTHFDNGGLLDRHVERAISIFGPEGGRRMIRAFLRAIARLVCLLRRHRWTEFVARYRNVGGRFGMQYAVYECRRCHAVRKVLSSDAGALTNERTSS